MRTRGAYGKAGNGNGNGHGKRKLRQVDLLSGHPLYCNNVRCDLHRVCAIRVHVARTQIQALLLIRRSSLISTYSLPVEI